MNVTTDGIHAIVPPQQENSSPGSGVVDIIKQSEGLLVGKDPLNIEPLYNQMIGSARNRYAML